MITMFFPNKKRKKEKKKKNFKHENNFAAYCKFSKVNLFFGFGLVNSTNLLKSDIHSRFLCLWIFEKFIRPFMFVCKNKKE